MNHIDTSDYYGPHITNQLIREALHPYPEDLVIVTKVGASRGADASWNLAVSRDELTKSVHDNLRNLGVEALDIVNLRAMSDIFKPAEGSVEDPLAVLADLRQRGLIREIGLSNVTPTQIEEGNGIVPIVCVQNLYNIAVRGDDSLIDSLAAQGIGRGLKIPVVSLSHEEAALHFGWLGMFAGLDMPASSALTQERLGWRPTQTTGMIADLDNASAFAA